MMVCDINPMMVGLQSQCYNTLLDAGVVEFAMVVKAAVLEYVERSHAK